MTDSASKVSRAGSLDATVTDGAEAEDVGARVGRYVLGGRLGVGAGGTVFEAEDPDLGRRVAIKVIRVDERAGRAAARLLREAKSLAQLSHPNIVTVLDVGRERDLVFIAMELVDGMNLERWLVQEKPTWREVVRAYVEAARGLFAAHEHGIVHRDFKPANAMIDAAGRVRVVDFGLAIPAEEVETGSASSLSDVLGERMTQTGALLGTPQFMAPEQFEGEPVGPATDQYSWCLSIYEALWGTSAFDATSVLERRAAVVGGDPTPPPATADVPARIWRVIVRGLARDPAARWPSILAAAEALQSRRRGILVPLAFTVALGAAAIALVIPSAPAAPPQTDPPALPSAKAAADVDARLAEVRASLDDAGARRDGAAQAALLETLFSEAAANERPDVAARAAIRRSDLAFMLGDVAEAERWRQQAEVHVLRGSIMDVQELAVLEQLRGKAASIAGDDVQAEEDLRWAVFLATFPGGHDPLRERTLRRALGEHLLERGRPEEALLEFETAHQRLTDAFGVDDARVIESYMDLGVGTVRAGDPARGYAIVREACDRPEFTAVSEIAVGCLTNLGMAEQYAGDLPAARRSFEAALEMLRAQPRRDEHREAVLHSSLGIVLQQLGDESGALEHLQRSMTLFESVLGPEHPLTLETALNIAELVIARGDVERGRARLRKIVATLQRNGASKIERGWPVALLARAVEPDEAIPLLEEVLDGSSLVEADPIAAAWCMYELGRVVFERGEHARGLALVRRARTLTETTRDARYDQEALPPADRWLNTHADRGTK